MLKDRYLFPLATLLPVPLIALAALLGGAWPLAALASVTALVAGMDRLLARFDQPEAEFPAGTGLSVGLALLHFPLLALVVAALAGGWLSAANSVALFVAAGLWIGQVGNANGHELIHRSDKRLFRLGKWVFISLGFGHHATAHPQIHHRFVATPNDPNSAQLGESFYAFAPRAWAGSWSAGWEIELAHLRQIHGRPPRWRHPYGEYIAGALGLVAVVLVVGGLAAVAIYVALSLYAQAQLLLSDYVQHYGLIRRDFGRGRLEPVGDRHSWNAPHPWSSRMMMHAPRHSDHHAHPTREFQDLRLPAAGVAPTLPHALPVMAVIALWPRAWRRLMDHRAAEWQLRPPVLRAVA